MTGPWFPSLGRGLGAVSALCGCILSGLGFTSSFALDRLYILGRCGLISVEWDHYFDQWYRVSQVNKVPGC